MKLDFCTYRGYGLTYLICDPNRLDGAERLGCCQAFGLGTDGVLVGPICRDGGFAVQVLRPDGQALRKGATGLLLFAKYLADAGYLAGHTARLLTDGGAVTAALSGTEISLELGAPSFFSADIPVTGPAREVLTQNMLLGGQRLRATCLSVGEGWCVARQGKNRALALLGRAAESAPQFPRRVSLCLMRAVDKGHILADCYECGVGAVPASGSGAAAAMAAGYRIGKVGRTATVVMRGGSMTVTQCDGGTLRLTADTQEITGCALSAQEARLQLGL